MHRVSLKILGLSRLGAVNLGDRYTKTQTYDAAEYYAPQDDYAGYERMTTMNMTRGPLIGNDY
jgi:hypothetical protein